MLRCIAATGFAGMMLALTPTTSAQLIDAGQQAMIMHQGNLLEQQTAPNNPHPNQRKPKDQQLASSAPCKIASISRPH